MALDTNKKNSDRFTLRRKYRPPSAAFLNRISYPQDLPIVSRRDDIIEAIRRHKVVVITGETGSGKTTQIPKMCIEAGRGYQGMIACTQPRRVAAISTARRIAEEMGEELGRSVAYKIRFEKKIGTAPHIKIMTDGILLMETQIDHELSAYDTIIVDEAHERSLNIDFIFGIMKRLLIKRSNLSLIITSATIDCDKFSRAFDNAPIIEVSGRTYPVEVLYRPIDGTGDNYSELGHPEAAVLALEDINSEHPSGDILIFMPTERDVRETCGLLEGRFDGKMVVLPLFARLSWSEQQRIFHPAGVRKVIVATNIAETSITIPGIRYVIDTGTARISHYNPRMRTNSLPVKGISRSSADQRKGRCGRVERGKCIRLYGEDEYNKRPLFTSPEILRSNLAGVILKMLSLNLGDVSSFPFVDVPSGRSIRDGLDILQELGAVRMGKKEGAGQAVLTEIGRLMSQIPLDPRLSRMLIEARKEGCLEEMAIIAAALSVQDPRERPSEMEEEADRRQKVFNEPSSDFLTLLNIWKSFRAIRDCSASRNRVKKYCRDHFLSYRRMREWQDVYDQIITILREDNPRGKDAAPFKDYQAWYAAIHKSVLSGYLSNIAVRKDKNIYQAAKGREVVIFPGSGLFNRGGKWIVAVEIFETSRLYAGICANVECEWLEPLGGDLCRFSYSEPHWEKGRGDVVALEQVSLFGLVIVPRRSVSYGPVAPDEAGQIFIRQGLLAGEVRHAFPFLMFNRALMEETRAIEERLRRSEYLAGEEELAGFYEKRLPGVYNIRMLQILIKDKGNDRFLHMQESDVLARPPDPDELALYPQSLACGDKHFPLTYRFNFGKADDGVTVMIPLHLISEPAPEKMEWMVPGLLREKVAYMLKGLPKEYRKKLLPLNGTCDIIIRDMSGRSGSFLSSLANLIFERFNLEIPASAWPVETLPEHLMMRFAIVDEDREVATGRDLLFLQRETIGHVKSNAFEEARRLWEKKGVKDWDFGALPECIDLQDRSGKAYPALSPGEAGLDIRLFLNKEEALISHKKGVYLLYALRFKEKLAHLKKNISLPEEMKAWTKGIGGAGMVETAIFKRAASNLFEIDVRTPETFYAHAALIETKILPEGERVRGFVIPVIKSYQEVGEQLRHAEATIRGNRPALQFIGNLRYTLSALAPPHFIDTYSLERMIHLPRYMQALAIGAQRGLLNLGKAQRKAKEIRSILDELDELTGKLPPSASAEKNNALSEYRWMIEEYRVSLFAQELKTPCPVSRKKLDDKLREIQRIF